MPPSDSAPESTDQVSSLGALVTGYLEEQYAALVAGDAELGRGNLDVVHPTRVASRRYRSILAELEPLFEESEAMVLEESLRWWGRVLGRVRDVQIAGQHLEVALARLPEDLGVADVSGVVDAELARREEQARAGLAKAMDRPRYATMLRRLEAWHDDPPVGGSSLPEEDVASHVKQSLRRFRKRLDEAHAAGDPEDLLHDARKAAKRARYVAELARPVLGRRARDVASEMTEVQDRLGEQQDRAVVRDLLLDLMGRVESGAVPLDGPRGFTLGILYAMHADELGTGGSV